MKIRIFNEEDRMRIAAILVKNGYRVSQGKERRATSKNTYDYYLEYEDIRELASGGRSAGHSRGQSAENPTLKEFVET